MGIMWNSLRLMRAALMVSNGILLSCSTGMMAMGAYVITDPHLANMYGSNEVTKITIAFTFLGGCLFATSILGCHALVLKDKHKVSAYLAVLFLLATTHLYYATRLEGMTDSSQVQACVDKGLDQQSCKAFTSSNSHVGSYFLWQQIWAEAMKPVPDDSAQAVLQFVQDKYHCCGFGDRKSCLEDTSFADWMIDGKQPKQRCSLPAPREYCYNSANPDGSYVAHCSIRNEWDFPYGTFDECQDKNQQSGFGCALPFTVYINNTIRRTVHYSLWVVFFEVVCGITAAILFKLKPTTYRSTDEYARVKPSDVSSMPVY